MISKDQALDELRKELNETFKKIDETSRSLGLAEEASKNLESRLLKQEKEFKQLEGQYNKKKEKEAASKNSFDYSNMNNLNERE